MRISANNTLLSSLLAAAVIGALALAGCGSSSGPSVAELTASTTSSANAGSPSRPKSAVAFSACMRSHGVPNFPDPNSKGLISGNGVDPRSPVFTAAQKACQSLLPGGGNFTTEGTGALSGKRLAQLLRFSKCMREHGEPNFPDPSRNGIAAPGIDPRSPAFQAAQKACQSLLPGRAANGAGVQVQSAPAPGGGS